MINQMVILKQRIFFKSLRTLLCWILSISVISGQMASASSKCVSRVSGKERIVSTQRFQISDPWEHIPNRMVHELIENYKKWKSMPERTAEEREAKNKFKMDIFRLRYKPNNPVLWVALSWISFAVVAGHALPSLLLSPIFITIFAIGQIPVVIGTDALLQIEHHNGDNKVNYDSPQKGQYAMDFLRHHLYPRNLEFDSYASQASPFARAVAPMMMGLAIVSTLFDPVSAWHITTLLASEIMFLGLHGMEIHRQNHMAEQDLYTKTLIRSGIAAERKAHNHGHHDGNFNRTYQFLNGKSDPYFRVFNFWETNQRKHFEQTGRLPHTWFQSPMLIPKDLLEEFSNNLSLIGPELFHFMEIRGSTALRIFDRETLTTTEVQQHKQKLESVKDLIRRSREHWISNFINSRLEEYLAKYNSFPSDAEAAWQKETREFPWIYGQNPSKLKDLIESRNYN